MLLESLLEIGILSSVGVEDGQYIGGQQMNVLGTLTAKGSLKKHWFVT